MWVGRYFGPFPPPCSERFVSILGRSLTRDPVAPTTDYHLPPPRCSGLFWQIRACSRNSANKIAASGDPFWARSYKSTGPGGRGFRVARRTNDLSEGEEPSDEYQTIVLQIAYGVGGGRSLPGELHREKLQRRQLREGR